jgi:hypothetical protein
MCTPRGGRCCGGAISMPATPCRQKEHQAHSAVSLADEGQHHVHAVWGPLLWWRNLDACDTLQTDHRAQSADSLADKQHDVHRIRSLHMTRPHA